MIRLHCIIRLSRLQVTIEFNGHVNPTRQKTEQASFNYSKLILKEGARDEVRYFLKARMNYQLTRFQH